MRRQIVCLVLAVLGPASNRSAARADDEMTRKFLAEYPAASRKLGEFYSNLILSANVTYWSGRKTADGKYVETGAVERVDSWEVRGSGDMLRWVSDTSRDSATSQYNLSQVIVAAPALSFKLHKSVGSSGYVITSMAKPTPKQYRDLVEGIRVRAPACAAPYCVFDSPIWDFIADKGFVLRSVDEVVGAEGKFIKVQWENAVPPRRGYFLFSSGDWALREFDFHFLETKYSNGEIGDSATRGLLEYSGIQDGLPLLRRVKTWRTGLGETLRGPTTEVVKLVPGPAPAADFTPAAFGLKIDSRLGARRFMLYMLGMAAFCGVLALISHYLRKRESASS